MQRYVLRMFADEWKQWAPAIAVVSVISTMLGLCIHQFAWTMAPSFRDAVADAGVPLAEFQILSVTIYTVIALVSWVALTVVGHASVQSTRHSHALWLLLGASPRAVFLSTLLVLLLVSLCGATSGAIVSSILSFWAIPAFNSEVSASVELPRFTIAPWSPVAIIIASSLTTLIGGIIPARRASHIQPGIALRTSNQTNQSIKSSLIRVCFGLFFFMVAVALVVASKFALQLGSTSPGSMFNLSVNAGISALFSVYLLCPEIVRFVFWALHKAFEYLGLVIPALGTRAAADRAQINATTIAPLAAGLGGIGLLLCAVRSVAAMTQILQPGTSTNLTDVWTIVAVVIVSMLSTSAAVVSLSARGRGREIALLQAAGMSAQQVRTLIIAESFAMSVAATFAALVPVIISGLVCSFVSAAALNGNAVVVWPFLSMLLGLFCSWVMMFMLLHIPTIAYLREGPGLQLREQGN